MDWFELFDDPRARRSRPSRWEYNAAEQRIEQLSNIWGGSPGPNTNKPGTYLVLREAANRPPLTDLDFMVDLTSEDNDGVGVVFRWQDVDNFYFFIMDSGRGFRLMGKKVEGDFQDLQTPATDLDHGYETGTAHQLRIIAAGSDLTFEVDGQSGPSGSDRSISGPGRVGFMCRANNRAYFHGFELLGT